MDAGRSYNKDAVITEMMERIKGDELQHDAQPSCSTPHTHTVRAVIPRLWLFNVGTAALLPLNQSAQFPQQCPRQLGRRWPNS